MSQLTIPVLLLLVGLLAALPAQSAPKADFFVSPHGRDTWSGRLSAPNRARTDGPFATVERAQQAVRSLRAARSVTVLLRGGTYTLKQPLVFTPEDSGTPGAPIVYAAYPKEKPVLSGGTRLTGWQSEGRGWTLTLPPDLRDGGAITQLWVNGQRRYRPRLPKKGYYFISEQLSPSAQTEGKGWDRFRFTAGDIHADWYNLNDVEVLGFQIWTMARFRIGSVEAERNIVNFTGRTLNTEYFSSLPTGGRYLLENVREALTEPGEWYLDSKTGLLTYLPMPGESPSKTEVVAPRLETLVRLKGEKDRPVQHLAFRGLTFAHTNWVTPPEGYTFYQAEGILGAAVTAEEARDCAFDGCAITHVGAYALELGAGTKRCRVVNCELTDMAAGGVKIGTTGFDADEERVASHNTVENSLIAHGGRMHPAGIGVWIGHSPYNTIRHNEIADFYYTGISVGWSWGYGPSQAHHNTLEYNHIHDIGQGVLSDMGGTYTLGAGMTEGTQSVQRGNVIHDVNAFGYGGWGIYFDEGTTGMLAENNLVYRTKSAGFHQHYGKENIVRNNIFAFGREAQVMRTRVEEHRSFTFERNIVYWTEGPLLGSNWSGDLYKLDHNLYWNAAGELVTFAGMPFDQWQARGQDTHSLIADPLFVAPEKGDFRVKPGSPAEKVGFQPFDYRRAGRTGAKRAPVQPARVFPAPPPPAPPQPIVQDFEEVEVGQKPSGAMVFEENDRFTIRATEEQAASGKRSLKFADGPGQKANYNPHMFYDPGFTSGVMTARFAMRLEPGALMYHEWRDAASPYRVGPSIRIAPDGTLTAGGRPVMQLPHGTWIRFEITCGLGPQAKGTWDLVVRLPGRTAPMRFSGLPCSPQFRELRWFGFTADGAGDAVFYLDDLELRPRR